MIRRKSGKMNPGFPRVFIGFKVTGNLIELKTRLRKSNGERSDWRR